MALFWPFPPLSAWPCQPSQCWTPLAQRLQRRLVAALLRSARVAAALPSPHCHPLSPHRPNNMGWAAPPRHSGQTLAFAFAEAFASSSCPKDFIGPKLSKTASSVLPWRFHLGRKPLMARDGFPFASIVALSLTATSLALVLLSRLRTRSALRSRHPALRSWPSYAER